VDFTGVQFAGRCNQVELLFLKPKLGLLTVNRLTGP